MEKMSRLGIGTIPISGGWKDVSDTESIEMIQYAIDAGINWIDTAPIYGLGRAETVVSKAIKGRREKVFIATKCGLYVDSDKRLVKCLNPSFIIQEIDNSLLRLGIDFIDLYQCHWPDSEVPFEETFEILEKLQSQGKIRKIGICNYDVNMIKSFKNRCSKIFSLQHPYNLFRCNDAEVLFSYCQKNNIHILSYSPLCSGLLSNGFKLQNLSPTDWRLSKKQWFSDYAIKKVMPFIKNLSELAAGADLTLSQLALGWVLANNKISFTIIGARNRNQLEELLSFNPNIVQELLPQIQKIMNQYEEL